MSRVPIFVLYLFALLSCLSHVIFIPAKGQASDGYPVHNFETGLSYKTIQEAIDAPETSDGDLIFVEEGIYYEHIVLDKSLTLIGENRSTTIIDGAKNGTVVHVTADNVSLSSFTIQNSGSPTTYGIELMAQSCTVDNNIIRKNGNGILLMQSARVVITRNTISDNRLYGIWMGKSSNTIISGNNITNNNFTGMETVLSSDNIISTNNISYNDWFGIEFYRSNNTIFIGNTIANNKADGIALGLSHANKLTRNSLKGNSHGVSLYLSNQNTIFCNNFIQNRLLQARSTSTQNNVWDNGYPSGGNYWSSYNGTDDFCGRLQDVTGSDGIGDNAYTIDSEDRDNYPLMGSFLDFNATSECHVQTICNSTISDFQFIVTMIGFNVSGEDGATGFCRICIPTALMNGTYRVFVNNRQVPHIVLPCSNNTQSYVYFTYDHSAKEVLITLYSPRFKIIPLLTTAITLTVIAIALAVILHKAKHSV